LAFVLPSFFGGLIVKQKPLPPNWCCTSVGKPCWLGVPSLWLEGFSGVTLVNPPNFFFIWLVLFFFCWYHFCWFCSCLKKTLSCVEFIGTHFTGPQCLFKTSVCPGLSGGPSPCKCFFYGSEWVLSVRWLVDLLGASFFWVFAFSTFPPPQTPPPLVVFFFFFPPLCSGLLFVNLGFRRLVFLSALLFLGFGYPI